MVVVNSVRRHELNGCPSCTHARTCVHQKCHREHIKFAKIEASINKSWPMFGAPPSPSLIGTNLIIWQVEFHPHSKSHYEYVRTPNVD